MPVRYYNRLAWIALFFAVLCVAGVIAFHFPQFLSTPRLREVYDTDQLRRLLFVVMALSLGGGLISLFFSERRGQALAACALTALASVLGGSQVEVQTPIRQLPVYLSLDLIILDLFFMSLIFVPLERLAFLRRQRFLRPGLRTDLMHYGLNHLLMGGLYYLIALPGTWLNRQLPDTGISATIQSLPVLLQVVMILFVADFTQYWVHRFLHFNQRLWQFHKIHYSSTCMDWLASSRLHIMDVIITRSISYIPVVLLGFSGDAVQLYLPVVALQALFVHANVRLTFGPLRYILTTPRVHHWHHSDHPDALDKNFAVSFSCIDVLFGTFHCPREWPEQYGLAGERISDRFYRQLVYPFLHQLRGGHGRDQDAGTA